MKLGDKIYNLRTGRKMSQIELSRVLGVSQASITGWETGRVKPTVETINKIAKYFNVSANYLLQDDTSLSEDYSSLALQRLHRDPKLKILFDKTQYLQDQEMDVVLGVINAIVKEREPDE